MAVASAVSSCACVSPEQKELVLQVRGALAMLVDCLQVHGMYVAFGRHCVLCMRHELVLQVLSVLLVLELCKRQSTLRTCSTSPIARKCSVSRQQSVFGFVQTPEFAWLYFSKSADASPEVCVCLFL
jgi:hypothetical protein